MKGPDDSLDDLEARLRAWQPAIVPSDVLARLVAAGPVPRRLRRSLPRIGMQFLAWGLFWWVYHASRLPEERPATQHASKSTHFADPTWNPGTDLTMTLATGIFADNVSAPWRLDGGPATADGLFGVRSADGKLPLKVDCQF